MAALSEHAADVSENTGGELRRWDVNHDGQKLNGPKQSIRELLHVRPWEDALLTRGDSGEVYRFQAGKKQGQKLIGPSRDISQLLLMPAWGDAVVAAGGDGELYRFQPESQEGQKLNGPSGNISHLLHIPTWKDAVVAAGGDGELYRFQADSRKGQKLTGPSSNINQLLLMPTWGDAVVTAGDNGEVYRFQADSHEGQKLTGPSSNINQLLHMPTWGDAVVAAGDDGEVYRFQAGSDEGQKLTGPSRKVFHLLHMPAWGDAVVTAGDEGEVYLFQPGSHEGQKLTGPSGKILYLNHMPAWGDAVVTAGDDGVYRFQAGSHEGQKLTGPSGKILHLLDMPTWGDAVVTAGDDGEVYRFQAGSHKGQKLTGPSGKILHLLHMATWGDAVVAAGGDGEMYRFLPGSHEGKKLTGPSRRIRHLVRMPGWGDAVITAGDDGELYDFQVQPRLLWNNANTPTAPSPPILAKDQIIAVFTWVNGIVFFLLIFIIWRVLQVTAPGANENTASDDKSITEVIPNILLWAGLGMLIVCFNKYMYLPPEENGFGFPCPLTLTCLQMSTGVVMTNLVKFVRPDLMPTVAAGDITLRQFFTAVLPIGIVFASYLSIGNSAYLYLSVAFIQMLKSAGPIAVHLIASLAGLERITVSSITAVCIIALGVLGASVGEISFSWFGFALQLTAFFLDGFRLVMMKSLLTTGRKMDPLSGLYYYSPVCVLALLGPVAYFEGAEVLPLIANAKPWLYGVLLLNGLNAFALNCSMMMLFSRASATTVSVASVVRDIVLTFGSAMLFHTEITKVQVLGYLSACIGVKLWDELKARPTAFDAAVIEPLRRIFPSNKASKAAKRGV
jgi:hypothetical protein